MAAKKEPETMLTARVPTSLVKALDKAARQARRSRSGEVVLRLQDSLKAAARRSPA
jgi:hypothetical protein